MTAKRKPPSSVDAAIILFSPDRRKPRAARFSAAHAVQAQAFAIANGLNALRITEKLLPLARRLPKGKLVASGRGAISTVRAALHREILSAAGRQSPLPPPTPPVESNSKATNTDPKGGGGDGLITDSTALAYSPDDQAWFEVIVKSRDGDTLTLVWRDYSDLPRFNRNITQIALLHPKMGKPS
jgi:hypothetical protein